MSVLQIFSRQSAIKILQPCETLPLAGFGARAGGRFGLGGTLHKAGSGRSRDSAPATALIMYPMRRFGRITAR
jgi:hypothetical protein